MEKNWWIFSPSTVFLIVFWGAPEILGIKPILSLRDLFWIPCETPSVGKKVWHSGLGWGWRKRINIYIYICHCWDGSLTSQVRNVQYVGRLCHTSLFRGDAEFEFRCSRVLFGRASQDIPGHLQVKILPDGARTQRETWCICVYLFFLYIHMFCIYTGKCIYIIMEIWY